MKPTLNKNTKGFKWNDSSSDWKHPKYDFLRFGGNEFNIIYCCHFIEKKSYSFEVAIPETICFALTDDNNPVANDIRFDYERFVEEDFELGTLKAFQLAASLGWEVDEIVFDEWKGRRLK